VRRRALPLKRRVDWIVLGKDLIAYQFKDVSLCRYGVSFHRGRLNHIIYHSQAILEMLLLFIGERVGVITIGRNYHLLMVLDLGMICCTIRILLANLLKHSSLHLLSIVRSFSSARVIQRCFLSSICYRNIKHNQTICSWIYQWLLFVSILHRQFLSLLIFLQTTVMGGKIYHLSSIRYIVFY
jgi:hypothetical protein